MTTSIDQHPLTCDCDRCEQLIINQFHAFHCATYEASIRHDYMICPKCQRQVKGRRRRNFQLWSCWECIMQVASVTRIVNSRETDKPEFAFAIKEDGATSVYFHLNRHAEVLFDGSDHAYLKEPESDVIMCEGRLKVHDVIVYQEFVGTKGPKALWWAFEQDLHEVKCQIDARPLFRLIRRTGRIPLSRLQEKAKYEVLRESKNINDFRLYPDAHEINDIISVYFEYHDTTTDAWIACADPRSEHETE